MGKRVKRGLFSRVTMMVAAALLAACQSSQVTVDYDTGTDFSHYQRYAWKDDTSGTSKDFDPLLSGRVKAAITDELNNHRFTAATSADAADFLVRYFVTTSARSNESQSRGGIGLGSGGGGTAMGVSLSLPLGGNKITREAQIIIDLHDAKTGAMQWRGTNNVPLGEDTPEEITALIRTAVKEILGQFPPQNSQ